MAGVAAVARLVHDEIATGHFQRMMALMAAFSAIVSGVEAYLQHARGNFSNRWMWTPVLLTPPSVIAAGEAVISERSARTVLPAVAGASFVDGLIGFVLHLRGVHRMPGGFGLGRYNLVMGPPLFAPLLMCIVGALGLYAAALRPETVGPRQALLHLGRHPRPSGGLVRRLSAEIATGRFQRGMAVTAAGFAVLAGGEAYFEHLRGSYNDKLMWTPILVTPPMVGAAIGAAVSERMATRVLPAASAATFLDGVLGFGLHLRGIHRMPGGFHNLRFTATLGPPLFAPLLFSAVGLLGMVAAMMRRGGSADGDA